MDKAEMLARAAEEYRLALERFNQVTEPELVDAAIHEMEAARLRLNHLIKEAKERGTAA